MGPILCSAAATIIWFHLVELCVAHKVHIYLRTMTLSSSKLAISLVIRESEQDGVTVSATSLKNLNEQLKLRLFVWKV